MKILLFITSLVLSCPAIAQIQEGTLVVGGGLNFTGSSSKSDGLGYADQNSSRGGFNISSSYEKFTNNSTAFGFFLAYNYNSRSGEYDYGTNTQEYHFTEQLFSVGPQMSNYIPIREKLYFTVSSNVFFGIGNEKDRETDDKVKLWSAGLNVRPGLVLFLTDNFALSAGIGNLYYSYSSRKLADDDSGEEQKENQHNYGLNFSANTFSVGLKYFLRTAKSE